MTAGLRAQAPQRFTYQAVVRNDTGYLVSNHQVGLRISIVQSAPQGAVVYSETHQPVTNENGLFTVLVGSGQVQLGRFEAIRWGEGPYYIKSEADPLGGTAYTMEAVQQLVSVPYALHAVSADALTHPVNYDSIVNTAINNAGFLLSEQQVL
ncbi:MAG: hypothetical protein KBT04_05660, partial [Bacteroidales bacterium]|nr:hypothetical protein [Candidatus Colimorpha onthohippi]